MWRAQVRELVYQIAVRPNLISCHLSVREHRQENVDNIVGQCPAIVRKARRAARVIWKNVWQQLSRDAHGVLRPIAARVFQFVREDANEAIIIRRLPVEVRLPLLSGEENRLQWPSTPVCLDPAFSSFVQYASPKSHHIGPQSRVGHFKHNTANILVREEIVASELHFVEKAVCIEKERIAAPTKEKTAVAA